MKFSQFLKVGVCIGLLNAGFSLGAIGGPLQTKAAEKEVRAISPSQSENVALTQLKPHVWMHTSVFTIEGEPTPANGLVLETPNRLVLIDTPWNDELTEQLIDRLKKQFPKKELTDAIVTHAHNDRIGGIKTLNKYHVNVHSTELTADLAEVNGFDRPLGDLKNRERIQMDGLYVETYYPGKGHTEDNITVWFPTYKILFGGCLIKSLDTQTIIKTPGSYIDDWSRSVKKVMKKYNEPDMMVIPGHGNPGGFSLLKHTLKLVRTK